METDCKFCNKPAPYMPLREMEKFGAKVYFCKYCQAEYIHYEGGARASTSIYITINNRLYRWSCGDAIGPSAITARLWYVATPGVPGELPNQDQQLIASFGYFGENGTTIPDITPRNIRQKI